MGIDVKRVREIAEITAKDDADSSPSTMEFGKLKCLFMGDES